MQLDQWFLTAAERGNPATEIDGRRGDGRAWSEGNQVVPRIHGRWYFERLVEVARDLEPGAWFHFTDWRGDPDERLSGDVTLGELLVSLARRKVHVRGLVWRSHPEQTKFSEQEAERLGKIVNEAGGEILLDERVRRAGSHHQKVVIVRHPGDEDRDVAFLGGIDLCHGRNDDERHLGDPQRYDLDERYGPTPAWHDVQVELAGPVIGDLAHTFRERWEDPTPLDHRNPWRIVQRRRIGEPRQPDPLPDMPEDPQPRGPHAVQVLRTYPYKRPPFPFAPRGERSIARAYAKALRRARCFVYIEDQYLWSAEVASLIAQTLREQRDLKVVAVVPRYPEQDGRLSGPANRIGQQAAMDELLGAGGDRVAIYDIENERNLPIYVHAKVCIVDDVWAAVGSDNFNLRSWTHDSELSCAVVDTEQDEREPRDPGGQGDGARRFARDLRLQLWREHLGDDVPEEALVDAAGAFDLWAERAAALDSWHDSGRGGPRPPGRVRAHRPGRVKWWAAWWAYPIYRLGIDPDGRPRDLKKRREF